MLHITSINTMKLLLTALWCAVLLKTVKSYVLPIEKCRLEDSTCMVRAFNKEVPIFFSGIPELGIDKVEALDDISFDLSGLNFTLKNGILKDLREIKVDNVKWNTKKKHVDIEYHADSTLKGHYIAAGKILILPIEGDGQLKIKLKNVVMKIRLNYDIAKLADGKDHIRPLNYTFQFDVKDNAEYHLANLFKGNKKLSDSVLTFLNENWKDVTVEFGRPILEAAARKVFKAVAIFFRKVPIEDIALI